MAAIVSADSHDVAAHAHHEHEAHNRAGEVRTRVVVAITFAMMVGELIVGHFTGSTALKADGWHMGTHVGALGLSLAAYWYARTRTKADTFAFGTGKVYALAGFTSGIVLLIVAVMMIYEGGSRLLDYETVDYGDAIPVAVLGLVVNLISAKLLGAHHHYGHDHGGHDHGGHDHGGHDAGHDHHDHDHHDHDHDRHDHGDHVHAPVADSEAGDAKVERAAQATLDFNLRAAYIHILADAMTSLLAIGALVLGKYAGAWFLDPAMGIIGGGVIIWWTASLCTQAGRQLLDVVSSPDAERVVRDKLEAIDDVRVADLHVWELGPGRRSCIVSLVTAHPRELAYYRKVVLDALDLAHLTIEIHCCDQPHPPRARPPHAEHAHAHAH